MKYTNLTAAPEKVGGSEEGSRNAALRCASPWFSEVGTAADTSPLKMLSSDVDDEEARRRSAPGISRAAYVEGSQAGSTRIKPAARAPSSAPASPSPSPSPLPLRSYRTTTVAQTTSPGEYKSESALADTTVNISGGELLLHPPCSLIAGTRTFSCRLSCPPSLWLCGPSSRR